MPLRPSGNLSGNVNGPFRMRLVMSNPVQAQGLVLFCASAATVLSTGS
ncbi:MAG: hypothetical protein C207_00722 [Bradyrhizobium sp. DFCI-1]|nr:MAG: hypothetical protein C207_00722 [Bradyrhizobium sp. DFCI-1]